MKKINVDSEKNEKKGSIIRARRVQLGISQEALAHDVGVEQSYLSKIELDRCKAFKVRLRICKVLDNWGSN
jgi:transcriptional regulator with XRE-family HTH domain